MKGVIALLDNFVAKCENKYFYAVKSLINKCYNLRVLYEYTQIIKYCLLFFCSPVIIRCVGNLEYQFSAFYNVIIFYVTFIVRFSV